ncbi:hypothetical protein BSKO_08448 [Bryopsis sp. KO-2023]|nr:hypothetical protein BSKO_08448 [Bryopsis sp. KO-2023]
MDDVVITKRIVVKNGKAMAVPSGGCKASPPEQRSAPAGSRIRDLPPAFILDGKLYDGRGEEVDVGGEGVGRRFRVIDCTRKRAMEGKRALSGASAVMNRGPEMKECVDSGPMVPHHHPMAKLTDDQMQSNWDMLN